MVLSREAEEAVERLVYKNAYYAAELSSGHFCGKRGRAREIRQPTLTAIHYADPVFTSHLMTVNAFISAGNSASRHARPSSLSLSLSPTSPPEKLCSLQPTDSPFAVYSQRRSLPHGVDCAETSSTPCGVGHSSASSQIYLLSFHRHFAVKLKHHKVII